MEREAFAYQPFWCEENVWHLARTLGRRAEGGEVWLITGDDGASVFLNQRAAPEGEPVFWDYHVVLATPEGPLGTVWDLDTRLGFPVSALGWLLRTFPEPRLLPPPLRPRFRVVPVARYLAEFGSDRSHMRDARGGWLQPPPEWPAIRPDAPTLARMRDLDDPRFGAPLALEDLLARYGAR